MKVLILTFLLTLGALFVSHSKPVNSGVGPSFKGPVGLQLYSLRDQFKKDVPAHWTT